MELDISLKVLQYTEEELSKCCRITQNCAEQISEVLVSLEKSLPDETEVEMRRWLSNCQQNIWNSSKGLEKLCFGLKQIEEMYGQYEKELMTWQEKLKSIHRD